ncbi:MAG: 3'-5' exonuclease [candidate division WOR-3 bacterium]|nr:3'-5' exonuclease [candidate division WOR-3 bacterium]
MKSIVLDIETTGTNPKKDRIIEIAIIELNDFKIVNEFSTLIRTDKAISQKAYTIHGISEKMLVDAPTFIEISDLVREKLKDSILIGYRCLSFDLRFINYELFRSGKMPVFPSTFDLSKLNGYFNSRSLYQIAKKLNIASNVVHRAMPDARITLKIVRWLVERFSKEFILNNLHEYNSKVSKIVDAVNGNQFLRIIYRGKYRISEHIGFPIEINENYLILYNKLFDKFYKLYAEKIIDVEAI